MMNLDYREGRAHAVAQLKGCSVGTMEGRADSKRMLCQLSLTYTRQLLDKLTCQYSAGVLSVVAELTQGVEDMEKHGLPIPRAVSEFLLEQNGKLETEIRCLKLELGECRKLLQAATGLDPEVPLPMCTRRSRAKEKDNG